MTSDTATFALASIAQPKPMHAARYSLKDQPVSNLDAADGPLLTHTTIQGNIRSLTFSMGNPSNEILSLGSYPAFAFARP